MGDRRSSSPEKKPHALVLSFPMQGHLNPLMQLATKLASPSYGFIITFALSQHHHAKLSSSRKSSGDAQEQQEQDNIRLVGVPDKLPPEGTGNADPFRDYYDSVLNMRDGVKQLLLHLNQQPTPVTLVLADTFVVWANELARQFHIPYVAFFPATAASACIFLHGPSLQSKGVLPFRDENDNFIANDPVADVPGIPPTYPRDFPTCFTFGPSHYRYQFALNQYENFRYCSGMLFNTLEELEPRALAALREDVPVVYPIGPLLLLCGELEAYRNNINDLPEQAECLQWLDTQNTASVLYISFGSIATMPASQITEIALGLEASRQPFLWVIRPDSVEGGSVSTNLPEGFSSRTKDRGLIISWAPQLAVLAHPAAGGFMTHCGWNSTMENLSTGGLPTICWPFVAEQWMNCRTFVDEWKVGIEIKRRPEPDGLVDKEEVERAVRALMQGEQGRQMRARATHLKETTKKATILEEGGSSINNFEAFVQACKSNTLKPRT